MATLFLHHKYSHPANEQYYNFRPNGQHPRPIFVSKGRLRVEDRG